MKGAKIKNLKDLRDHLNTLSDDQLKGPANVERTDEWLYEITDAYELDEDYFVQDEFVMPVSVFEPLDDDDTLDNYEIIPKGTVYLACDNIFVKKTVGGYPVRKFSEIENPAPRYPLDPFVYQGEVYIDKAWVLVQWDAKGRCSNWNVPQYFIKVHA
jgi:hypothetical protein